MPLGCWIIPLTSTILYAYRRYFTCNPLLLLNFGSGQRAALIEAVKCKYPYNYTADVPWFGVQDSGCLVLSAHKIEPCHQEPFSDYSLSELVTHKGYMCCKITIANQDLIVINTHLECRNETISCNSCKATSTDLRSHRRFSYRSQSYTMWRLKYRVRWQRIYGYAEISISV